jgi:endonuclease/exonuclease/phosphatase family metal-dependent hydrolase
MTYNVLSGGQSGNGCDWYIRKTPLELSVSNNDRIDNIVNVIKDVNPDIVFLQECNTWEDNDSKILKNVAKQLEMNAAVTPNRNKYKVAILSKYPMSNVHWLDDKNVFSHNIIFADVALDRNQTITVANQHFIWWRDPKWNTYNANTQKESYIKQCNELLGQLAENKDKPFVIAGDFNHTFDASNFDQKPLYGSITDLGYTDCCFSIYKNYSRVTSFVSKEKKSIGPIDFIFVSPSLAKNIVDADIFYSMASFSASDHLPVWADISLNGIK